MERHCCDRASTRRATSRSVHVAELHVHIGLPAECSAGACVTPHVGSKSDAHNGAGKADGHAVRVQEFPVEVLDKFFTAGPNLGDAYEYSLGLLSQQGVTLKDVTEQHSHDPRGREMEAVIPQADLF